MDERVSRRGVFRKILCNSVDVLTRILKEDSPPSVSNLNPDADMSPDQAGHLLRTRKTTKNNSGIHFRSHQECESSSKPNDH
jgi:hypothetical protein